MKRKSWQPGAVFVGKRFSRLEVLAVLRDGNRWHKTKCRVRCLGNPDVPHDRPHTFTVWAQHLRSGHTTSCGCYRRETARYIGRRQMRRREEREHLKAEFYEELRRQKEAGHGV